MLAIVLYGHGISRDDFPARKLIVKHEKKKKKIHHPKQRKLPAGFIQIRAGTGSPGCWLFYVVPI